MPGIRVDWGAKTTAAAVFAAVFLSLRVGGEPGQSIAHQATASDPTNPPAQPTFTLEEVSLNPTNFFVSLRFSGINTNLAPDYFMALHAYDGPPIGFTGAPRVRVSDCYHPTGSVQILVDKSSPLPLEGRTYDAFVTRGEPCCLEPTGICNRVYYKEEVYAPYPLLTNPVIAAVGMDPTNLVAQIRITVGQDLYTNTHAFNATNPSGFFRMIGTNLFPTNAVIERSDQPTHWN